MQLEGAQWLSGRVLDSRPKGRGFGPHRRLCVVSLSKNINPSLVLAQPRKTPPFITERLLMGRKESNQTNKNKNANSCVTMTLLPSYIWCSPNSQTVATSFQLKLKYTAMGSDPREKVLAFIISQIWKIEHSLSLVHMPLPLLCFPN